MRNNDYDNTWDSADTLLV